MLDKVQRLAEITIPTVYTDDSYNSAQDQLTNGSTSMGAQCVTNIVNKLVMAMFPSTRPFYKLATTEAEMQNLVAQLGIDAETLTDILSQGERDSSLELEKVGGRDTLYEVVTHLVVAGNILMDLSDKEVISAHPLRDYCVRRDAKGQPISIIIKECLYNDELEQDVRQYLPPYTPDHQHEVYTWIHLMPSNRKKMRMTKWVDAIQLPYNMYGGTWDREDCPYRPLTWRLPVKQHYGIGRVEEYFNDFGTYEVLGDAMSDGAILASQFRWLQNPGGLTRPEDFATSKNGDVIPGLANDLQLVAANIGQQLSTVMQIAEVYSRRVGIGFLLNSAVTRQAERVTAEELRLQAIELESSLGGVYSRLSKDIQQPLARWLLKRIDLTIKGTKITPVVVTGLDALSRNADLERTLLFVQDVTNLGMIQPAQRLMLNESVIIADMAAGRGVPKSRYVATQDVIQQRQQQMQQQAQAAEQPSETGVPQA